MKVFTIGVYGSSEEEYFNKLISNKIDLFCDIRQRRGVRGSEYSFVNSNRLQKKLSELGIKYCHILDLAPTKEIREHQKKDDLMRGEHKRDRNKLGLVFTNEYKSQILNNFDFDSFVQQLEKEYVENIVLFCVENNAEACHRSIVAKELNKRYNFDVTHL